MTFKRIVLRPSRVRWSGLRWRFAAFCVLAVVVALSGCGRKPDVPVGDGAERIRKLALAYVQYAASNGGAGPANQEALTKYLMQRNRLSKEEAAASFISPRDNQPYIIHWGVRPMGSAPLGPDPPKPEIIIVEKTGADGTRYVANGLMSIKQMSPSELAEVSPGD